MEQTSPLLRDKAGGSISFGFGGCVSVSFALAAAGEDRPAGGALRHTLAALPAAPRQVSRAGRQAAEQTADPWAGISCSHLEPTHRHARMCVHSSALVRAGCTPPLRKSLSAQGRTGGSIF